jgi:formylglycine-generating enzyme required for sulfatase activity
MPALAAAVPLLTQQGMLVGTPRYMAPEAWRAEPATPRTDIYSLGVLLYELATGQAPFGAATLSGLRDAVLAGERVPVAAVAPVAGLSAEAERPAAALARALGPVIDRCLAREPGDRWASCDELCAILEELGDGAGGGRAGVEGDRAGEEAASSPYRGLHPFHEEHRGLFFGREREARAILELLRGESLVVVTGDSGAGKSSLCRAGVLPLVEEGALGAGLDWATARLVPGRQPLLALAAALAPLVGQAEEALLARLHEEPVGLLRAVRQAHGPGRGLVLFVDQMEELVTQCAPEEAARFGEVLGALDAGLPGMRLLVAVRGDFLTRLAAVVGLGERLLRATYLLGPLSAGALERVIAEPARRRGVEFESAGLVADLARATEREQGGLPLLQFALGELWELRDRERRVIPAEALGTIGGVAGALARHADGVLKRLPAPERAVARRLLVGLVTGAGTRARRAAAELFSRDPRDAAVAEALVRGRLLMAHEGGEDGPGGTTYELAHEALIEGWGTLKEWLTAAGERRLVAQRIEAAAAEWVRLRQAGDALWRAGQLKEAAAAGVEVAALSVQGATFMAASRRSLRRQRGGRWAAALALPLCALLIYGAVALRQRHELDQAVMARLGEAEALAATAQGRNAAAERLRAAAFARFRAGAVAEGEAEWAQAQGEVEAVHRARTRIDGLLENALLLDPRRGEVRRRLGEALYEHALLAERDHRTEQRDNLLALLENFDEDGRLRERWRAPGQLGLTTVPAGATVRIARYEEDGGRRRLVAERVLGRTPVTERPPPGSYLLVFEAPGRTPVRYPLVVGRGERLDLRVELPEARAIPEGFVYVPPGRFLYGAADEENYRRVALPTIQPLHEVETGAYLIQRTEVSFADWLEFLRALPPAERTRRWPNERSFRGGFELRESKDGSAEILMQPVQGEKAFVLRAGEQMHYPDRERRAAQDWLRFPVAAITYGDAEAYVAWLDRSGQVPGARLCSEYEWERAARGADDRLYPWGDRLEPEDANVDATYGRKTWAYGPDEVGSYPGSASPFGVLDLAGNIWEWTRSVVSASEVVYRGGGWYEGAMNSRSANRQPGEPTLRDPLIGLRVCASWPPR